MLIGLNVFILHRMLVMLFACVCSFNVINSIAIPVAIYFMYFNLFNELRLKTKFHVLIKSIYYSRQASYKRVCVKHVHPLCEPCTGKWRGTRCEPCMARLTPSGSWEVQGSRQKSAKTSAGDQQVICQTQVSTWTNSLIPAIMCKVCTCTYISKYKILFIQFIYHILLL